MIHLLRGSGLTGAALFGLRWLVKFVASKRVGRLSD